MGAVADRCESDEVWLMRPLAGASSERYWSLRRGGKTLAGIAVLAVAMVLPAQRATSASTARGLANRSHRSPAPSVVLDSIDTNHPSYPAYKLALTYPQLLVGSTSARSRINAQIQLAEQQVVAAFEHQLATYRPPSPPATGALGTSTVGGFAETDTFNKNVLAFTLSSYNYTAGAAHGLTTVSTLNFNAKTGQLFNLANLFVTGSNWLGFLSTESRALLTETLGQLAQPGTIDTGTTPKVANFSGWALTPWGLQITFQNYQVGPYAAGTPSVMIPLSALAANARPLGPIDLAESHSPPHMVLLPATTSSHAGECFSSITYVKEVVPSPLLCSGGRINVAAWDALANVGLKVLGLQGDASASAVRSAMCADIKPAYYMATTLERSTEQLASLYNGWKFRTPPTTDFPGYCRH